MGMGRFVRRRTGENGIVAEHHLSDSKHRLLDFSACVVSGPLTKRTFESFLVVAELAFENDFRICWNRKICVCAAQHFHRLFTKTTHPVQFRQPRWYLIASSKE